MYFEGTGYADGLDVGCERKKGSRMTSRFLTEQLEGWSLLTWRRVLCDSRYVGLFSLGSHRIL